MIKCYIKPWFLSRTAAFTPRVDLALLKILASEERYHHVFRKLIKHLWYLSEELIALLLFDPEVSLSQKRKMVNAMQANVVRNEPTKKCNLDLVNDVERLELHYFANSNTLRFFTILDIDFSFLKSDPGLWQESKSYNDALKVEKFLRITNDNAERGVALIGEYNKLNTKDEDIKRYLLQAVQEHRKRFPSCNKRLLNS